MRTEQSAEATLIAGTTSPIVPQPRFRDAPPAEQLGQLIAALLLMAVVAALLAFVILGMSGEPLPVFDRTNVVDELPTRPPIYENV